MAVKWNKIYRGGVHRTTPETHEVAYSGAALQPGRAVVLDTEDGIAPGAAGFWYLIGESLHGSVDDATDADTAVRLYTPRSGDLYAGRAVAGLALVDDMPLTINADGRFAAVTPADPGDPEADPPVFPTAASPIHAYVDSPSSAHPGTASPTTLDQLIPIKIR